MAGIGNLGVAGCRGERPLGHIPSGARAGSRNEVDRGALEDFAEQLFIGGSAGVFHDGTGSGLDGGGGLVGQGLRRGLDAIVGGLDAAVAQPAGWVSPVGF